MKIFSINRLPLYIAIRKTQIKTILLPYGFWCYLVCFFSLIICITPFSFRWMKNAIPFDTDNPKYISNTTKQSRIVRVDKNTGSLKFTELKDEDEGIYQCIAENRYGVSYSRKYFLMKATKHSFPDRNKEVRKRTQPAEGLRIECKAPVNDPPGINRWVKYDGQAKSYVQFNDRIAMDKEGKGSLVCL